MGKRRPEADRYWEKVGPIRIDGCQNWTGALKKGYGRFHVWTPENTVRQVQATRWRWEHERGPIPDGLFLCHTCDNRACVRLEHLFLGTNADNLADMRRKGRGSPPPPSCRAAGWIPPWTKLSEDDVREIRRRYAQGGVKQRDLAEEYGIEQTNVSAIVRRKSWAHVA